jgi:hypothetical protein
MSLHNIKSILKVLVVVEEGQLVSSGLLNGTIHDMVKVLFASSVTSKSPPHTIIYYPLWVSQIFKVLMMYGKKRSLRSLDLLVRSLWINAMKVSSSLCPTPLPLISYEKYGIIKLT